MAYTQDIIFNGKSASQYGIRVWAPPSVSIPKKRIEEVELPGRNGAAIIDEGLYDNVERKYRISVFNVNQNGVEEPYYKNYSVLAAWLNTASGYLRLEDTYEPDVYRYGYIKNPTEVANTLNIVGIADIVFSCLPKAYVKQYVNGAYQDWKIEHVFTAQELSTGSVTLTINNNTFGRASYPVIEFEEETDGGHVSLFSVKTSYDGIEHLLSNMDEHSISSPTPWPGDDWGTNKLAINAEEQTIIAGNHNVRPYYPLTSEFPVLYVTELNKNQTMTIKTNADYFNYAKLTITPNFWRL